MVAVALLALVLALVVGAPGAQASPASKIRWHGCGHALPHTLQCGQISVPLDHRHPRGARIRLGFDRLRASDRKHRVGSLIVNPGGPGGSGSQIVALEALSPGLWHPALRRRFDLIGMDPRGIGLSTPVRCSPAVFNRPVSLFPRTRAAFRRLAAYSRAVGRSCRRRTGRLLAHIDTLSVARDMEALRRALGDGRLNFLGLSYGSEIGTTYAEHFPRRIRAMALDGILDHSVSSQALFADDVAAYEDSFQRFAAWCAVSTECPLHGRDAGAVFDALVRRADQQPIAAPQCQKEACRSPVTGDDIRLNAGNYLLTKAPIPALHQPGWNGFAQALVAAEAGDASAFATPRATSAENGPFTGLAIACLDYRPLARGFDDLVSASLLGRALAPHLQGGGEAWPVLVGCLRWPVPTVNPPHPLRIHGAPPILLANSTHDPSTPYRWAQHVLSQIPRAVLLTRDGDGHTSSFLRPSATNDAIARYLITRRTPRPNTVYPD